MLHVVTENLDRPLPPHAFQSDELNSPSSSTTSHTAPPKKSPLKMSIIGSPNNSGRFKKRQAASDFRSHHWSYLFETLRRTVDAIYEMCRADRSESECKEAMMILRNSAKDFQSLIDCFNVEDTFDQNNKKTAVAWEIRKTVGSPNKLISHSNTTGTGPMSVPAFSGNSAVRELKLTEDSDADKENHSDTLFNMGIKVEENFGPSRPSELGISAVKTITNKNAQMEFPEHMKQKEKSNAENSNDDDGWNLVKSRKKSRKRILLSSMGQNVGVATSSAGRSVAGAKVMYPRSAMDIPQTRASMAKMAYSRRLLWEKKQCEYRQKLVAQQKQQQQPRKSGSFPTLSRIGINFADPQAVTQSARALKHSLEQKRLENAAAKIIAMNNGGNQAKKVRKSGRFPKYNSCDSQCSLESIREETDVPKDDFSDPFSGSRSPQDDNVFCTKRHSQHHRNLEDEEEDEGIMLDSSRSLPLDLDRQSLISLAETNEEEAWQHLTEEEESLAQEEESLQKEIEEEERKAIDDEVAQIEAEEMEEEARRAAKQETTEKEVSTEPWKEIMSKWQVDCQLLSGVSWSELVEAELAEVRRPGQAAQMHEKLSSPSRKRNPVEAVKKHEERLAKAEEHRKDQLEEKSKRLKELSKRVEEVRRRRMTVVEIKKEIMDQRMEKAKENRDIQIEKIKKKARDEEEKVHEIAFIKELEANNRRHDKSKRDHDVEQRIKSIQDERQKKVGEKAAREAAAEERRKAAAEERASRMKELAEKKRKRQEQVEIHKNEQETQRQLAAIEKAREREDRIAEIRAAHQANTEELKHRIHQKQEESKRRHVENLEQIKLKASEMCIPKLGNEVQVAAHIQSIKHQNLQLDRSGGNEGIITVRPEPETVLKKECDPSKSAKLKKKRHKMRQKLLSKGREFEEGLCSKDPSLRHPDNPNLMKLSKLETDLKSRIDRNKFSKLWVDGEVLSLDKNLGEICRLIPRIECKTLDTYYKNYGIAEIVPRLLETVEKGEAVCPDRILLRAATLLRLILSSSPSLCIQIFFSSQIVLLADQLAYRLKVYAEKSNVNNNELGPGIVLELLLDVLRSVDSLASGAEASPTTAVELNGLHCRSPMLNSYLALSGVTESLTQIVRRATIEEENPSMELPLLRNVAEFSFLLMRLTNTASEPTGKNGSSEFLMPDLTQNLLDLSYTNQVGSQHDDVSLQSDTQQLSEFIIDILIFLAVNRRKQFEELVSSEVAAYEILHLSSVLISLHSNLSLRHKAILLVGHFATVSKEAQTLITDSAGGLLEQMCVLPFAYFSDPALTPILLPTLIVTCLNNSMNRVVLEQELSGILLGEFIEKEIASSEKADHKASPTGSFALHLRLPTLKWKEAMDYFMESIDFS